MASWYTDGSPTPAAKATRRVAVLVDGSPPSRHAYQWALANVGGGDEGVVVTAVTAVVPDTQLLDIGAEDFPGAAFADVQGRQSAIDKAVDEAAKMLDSLEKEGAAELAKMGSRGLRCRLERAVIEDPATLGGLPDAIRAFVESKGFDAVVVGSRGMGAVKRALLGIVGLGSMSNWCANNLKCPVTVVHMPAPAAEAGAPSPSPEKKAKAEAEA